MAIERPYTLSQLRIKLAQARTYIFPSPLLKHPIRSGLVYYIIFQQLVRLLYPMKPATRGCKMGFGQAPPGAYGAIKIEKHPCAESARRIITGR